MEIELPSEIIEEILVRMPVKSLLRFKCLCKRWCSLINDRVFIKKHIDFAKSGNHISRPVLSLRELELPSLQNPDKFLGNFAIGGYCDGVFCVELVVGWSIYLQNPCIRGEIKELPKSKLSHLHQHAVGFGYDSSVDDYKVVRIGFDYGGSIADYPVCRVEVFALKSNSWRIVDQVFPWYFLHHNPGIYHNGQVCWLAHPFNDSDDDYSILGFDLGKEDFTEITKLPNLEGMIHVYLGLLGEKFCLIENLPYEGNLWVLKEVNCWTKLATIPRLPEFPRWSRWEYCALMEDCRVLLGSLYGNLLLCNPANKTYEVVPLPRVHTATCDREEFYICQYFESLVSFKTE